MRYLLRNAWCVAFVFALLMSGTRANAVIELSLEYKDGDKVSDIVKIVAKAISADGIDKVEFRVDDQLRFTDTSTPYLFEWDTIPDPEGEHSFSVTAYDANGVSKRLAIQIKIDNEIAGGIAGVVEKARAALEEKDYEALARFGRRILKGDATNLEGARLLANAYAAKKDWNRAVAALEKGAGLEDNTAGLKEMATYRMQRALQPENAANLFADLVIIDETRRKLGDVHLKQMIKAHTPEGNEAKRTPEDVAIIGDALVNAGRFKDAIGIYEKIGKEEGAPNAYIARLSLAHILSGDIDPGMRLLRPVLRAKKDDAAVRAVYALALLQMRMFAEARATVDKDIADQNPGALVIASFASAVLGKRKEAVAFAQDATSLLPSAPEAHYALSLATSDLRLSEAELHQALALNTVHLSPYLNFAGRIANSKRIDRYELALNISDLVLKYVPKHTYAKLMQALIYMQTKKLGDAEPVLSVLLQQEGKSPDVQLAVAIFWELKGEGANATRALEAARKLDPVRFDRLSAPNPMKHLDFINREWLVRSGFFLNPSTLFGKKG